MESFKQRHNRAVKAAVKYLSKPYGGYKIIILDGKVFHLEAIRVKEIRKIRIALDEITKEDEKIVKEFKLPDICTKEIWCKKIKERAFEIREII